MKRKKNKIKRNNGGFDKAEKDIDNLIDDMAYLNESQNIRKSKDFLDNMYLLDD